MKESIMTRMTATLILGVLTLADLSNAETWSAVASASIGEPQSFSWCVDQTADGEDGRAEVAPHGCALFRRREGTPLGEAPPFIPLQDVGGDGSGRVSRLR